MLLRIKLSLQTNFRNAEGLVLSHVGFQAVCPEAVSPYKLISAVTVGFPIMIFTFPLLAYKIPWSFIVLFNLFFPILYFEIFQILVFYYSCSQHF